MKRKTRLDIPDITEKECDALRGIAKEQYGKSSISYFVTQFLKKTLQNNSQLNTIIAPPIADTDRLELRLSKREKQYLHKHADAHHMTSNTFAVSIIRNYLDKTPLLTAAEVEALYQSNAQLLRIGRNLNQIARQLNSMEGGSITSEQITSLQNIIDIHTEKVGNLLLANKRRNNE